jgi:hypothetical protein
MAKYIHKTRNSGDTILSAEWNQLGKKLEDINAKLDEETSVFNGPLTIGGNIIVKDSVNLNNDIVFGDVKKRFIIHSRGDNKDFLQITADKIDGSWDWSNGITLRKSGDVGIANANPLAKLDVNGNANINGELSVTAKISAANSDLYFTKTDHQHTGLGNNAGSAAIENDGNLYKALMILGRNIGSNNNVNRQVKVWDDLTVSRDLTAGGKISAANSDVYFTRTDHNHTGIGNATGYAAIENSKDYNTLMILGRNTSTFPDINRQVKVWDDLSVARNLTIGNSLVVNGYLYNFRPVAFSAYVKDNLITGDKAVMPMKIVSQNLGNAYNAAISKFIAPVRGLYLFTMTVMKGQDGWINWYLKVNDGFANSGGGPDETTERCLLTVFNSVHSSSRSLIVQLNANDNVYIQQQVANTTVYPDNYRSGLEGVLLYALPELSVTFEQVDLGQIIIPIPPNIIHF